MFVLKDYLLVFNDSFLNIRLTQCAYVSACSWVCVCVHVHAHVCVCVCVCVCESGWMGGLVSVSLPHKATALLQNIKHVT
jgi:hypothetical protein